MTSRGRLATYALLVALAACSTTTTTDGGVDAASCSTSPPMCSPGCSDISPAPTCTSGVWTCPPPATGCLCGATTTPPGCTCDRVPVPTVVCPDAGASDASTDAGHADAGCGTPPPAHCLLDCSGVEPPMLCVAGGWVCPAQPVCGDGGAVDAGPTFACASIMCARGSEYCDLSDVAVCVPLPVSCGATPSCACLAGMGHTSCADDGAGALTTVSPGG